VYFWIGKITNLFKATMAPDKLKKEVNYRSDTMATSEAVASSFFLNNNDQELIDRINNHDESALLQFTIKHLNILTRDIIRSGCKGIEKELMDVWLPLFYEKIKTFARENKDRALPEDWEYHGLYIKALKMDYGLAKPLVEKKRQTWRDFEITDKRIDFLNNLNSFLIDTEELIVARAKKDIPLLEARIKDSNATTSDYEYFVDINFATEASNGDSIYTESHRFSIHNIEENKWGLLCDEEDWRESGWLPTLKTRCCYLMHELVYHADLAHFIFDISNIWIETKTWDQSFVSLKTGTWETIKSDN
jgi:hypothetical protein